MTNLSPSNSPSKLRLLALHSFRTSAKIHQDQVKRSGLDKKLDRLIELVYIDAPNAATGPPQKDVAPFFDPPYKEWWNSVENEETGEVNLIGNERTFEYLEEILIDQGPFDGLWAFSQGTLVASTLLAMRGQGKLQQIPSFPRFAVLFGGFFLRSRVQRTASMTHLFDEPLDYPSIHLIGDKDYIRKNSHELAKQYNGSVIVQHPKGHVIPDLEGDNLRVLDEFLEEQLMRKLEVNNFEQIAQSNSKL